MKSLDYREYYHRNLPHIQPRAATFLVNIRLAGSLPKDVLKQLRVEAEELERKTGEVKDQYERLYVRDNGQRKLIGKWDQALHQNLTGNFWLKDGQIAEIVANAIRYHADKWFELLAYCIMPNHVHIVLTPYGKSKDADYSLAQIMHNIKRNSAKQANALMNRTGIFWQHESYDHFARDEAELHRIIKYVMLNPVKAGLVTNWKDWKWNYCKYNL